MSINVRKKNHYNMDNRSSSSRTLGVVIVLIIIALGVWYMLRTKNGATDLPASYDSARTGSQGSQTAAGDTDAVEAIHASGTTDAALDSDSAAIDAEIQGYAADTSAANE